MFPEKWNLSRIIRHAFSEVLTDLKIIKQNQETQMSALTDLQASIAKLQADVTAFIAANSGGATDAQLVALKVGVDAIDAQVVPAPAQPPANPPAPPATT